MKLEDYELGGTPLKSADIKKGKVLSTSWQPNLAYAWDDGVAIGRYLAELKNGKIMARVCHRCHRIMLPPRMFCELCFRPTDEWVTLKDTGTVNTFSIVYVNWDASRRGKDEPPLIPAVIEIDGARVDFGNGWGLIRASNTQPVLVLRFEADDRESLEEIRKAFADALSDHIDVSGLYA